MNKLMKEFEEEFLEDDDEEDDLYNNDIAEELEADDEISVEEEAFMRGYNSEEEE